MTALLATIVQWILGTVGKWAFAKLSDMWKDKVAKDHINEHVADNLNKMSEVVKQYEDSKDHGQLTEAIKDEIRRQKIKLEEDLINRIQRP